VFTPSFVHPFVEAEQRQRHRIVARREDDRVMALDNGEFLDGHRERMGLANQRERIALLELHIAVLAGVQRIQGIVKQRQRDRIRRLGRHVRHSPRRGRRIRVRAASKTA
jgi:hypothetical protein